MSALAGLPPDAFRRQQHPRLLLSSATELSQAFVSVPAFVFQLTFLYAISQGLGIVRLLSHAECMYAKEMYVASL